MTSSGKALLFLSSYAPLFALLAFRTSEDSRRAMWVFAGLSVLGLVCLWVVLRTVLSRQQRRVTLVAVDRAGEQTAAYAATYLLPFIAAAFPHWQDWVVFAGFLGVVGLVYVQSEMIYLNPLMALIGYRILRARYQTEGARADAEERQIVLISSRDNVRQGDIVAIAMLGSDVAVER